MLKRLNRLTSVTTWNANSGANFQRSTVLYAENGRGKTTLSAVIRSLATNDPLHIMERSAIGAATQPHVELLFELSGKNVIREFKNGRWNLPQPDIEVFDTRFISDNVYSGDLIDPEHRRQLYHFVLGAANKSLAEAVDDLNRAVRDLNVKCAYLEAQIRSRAGGALSTDEFTKLAPLVDGSNAIASQIARVSVAAQDQQILLTPIFRKLRPPVVELAAIRECMAHSVDDIAASAEEQVRDHLQHRLGENGREWVEHGIRLIGDKSDCPFCGLDTSSSALVIAYRIAFGDAYKQESARIAALISAYETTLSDFSESARMAMTTSDDVSPFWKGHDIQIQSAPLQRIIQLGAAARVVLDRLFYARRLDLNRPVAITPADEAALQCVSDLLAEVSSYNESVEAANAKINVLKNTAAKIDVREENERLARMRLQTLRHSAEVDDLCSQLAAARADKTAAEANKEEAKSKLDSSSSALFAQYQEHINRHLVNSGCGFAIDGTRTSYAGGKPRTEYQLQINGESVELAPPKGNSQAPCFRNTLSDGDRSALALAFFLARLDLDPDLSKKIIVIDDPMTSLDVHRRAYTIEQIARLSGLAMQLIVLTHDSMFAREVWERLLLPKTALTLAPNGKASEIAEWDIADATASNYDRRCKTLRRCVNGEKGLDLSTVATSIRPVLEGNLRMRFPEDLKSDKWLGDLIAAIRDAPETSTLSRAKKHLSELTALNDYSKKFHHDGTPSVVIPIPTLAELQPYCRRTLDFIAGS